MSTAAICEPAVAVRRDRRPCAGPRGITLGQLLTRAHEDVHARGTAACPICGGSLQVDGVDARCADCSSRLG